MKHNDALKHGNTFVCTPPLGTRCFFDPLFGTLDGHTKVVNSVACSSDRTKVISGSHDKTIRTYLAQTN